MERNESAAIEPGRAGRRANRCSSGHDCGREIPGSDHQPAAALAQVTGQLRCHAHIFRVRDKFCC